MTAYPPQGPLSYATPYQNPNPRPTSVTVLAILGIILGALALLGTICGIIPYIAGQPGANPVVDAVKRSSVMLGWTIISSVIGFLLGLLLLVASISALSLKPWARGAMLFYAVANIVMTTLNLIMMAAVMYPLLANLMNSSNPAVRAGAIGGLIGGFFGAVLGYAYPVCVLIFMRKPHVLAAFQKNRP